LNGQKLSKNGLIFLATFLAGGILATDIWMPLGVAGGVPYVAVVLVSLWLSTEMHVFITATACTALTILGYFLSPDGSVQWVVLTNRFLALFAIWATAVLGLQHKRKEAQLEQQRARLDELVKERTIELEMVVSANLQSLEEARATKFRLFMLSDISTQISQMLDTEPLAEAVVSHAVSLLDAEAGCLMLIDSATQRLEMANHFAFDAQHLPELDTLSIPLEGDTEIPPEFVILRNVAKEGKTQLYNDATAAQLGRKNLVVAPVFGRDILGVLAVCDKEGRGGVTLEFNDEDAILLESFATQAGVSIENARLYHEAIERQRLQTEMEEAARIQENLLPDESPNIPGYQSTGLSIPRRDGVGGDYYDYIPQPEDSWGLVIADISGKGVQAALLMATLRAGLRSVNVNPQKLADMAIALNTLLYEGSPIDKYATLFYAHLQPETGTFTSINAGHNLPIVIRSDGSSKRLGAGGLMVGMYPPDMILGFVEYEQETTQLGNGDVVLLFTDGVSETTNVEGEEFGEERLEALVCQMRHADVTEIADAIYNAAIEFQGEAPQFDDLTLMVIKKE
jgi:phosphoserine phosphatase RsbU/P